MKDHMKDYMKDYRKDYRKGYTKIKQFNTVENSELNSLVVSDHAEIMVNTKYGVISSWNISNPVHHHYFGINDSCSFSRTHMFYDKNFIENKIYDQIESISSRFESGEIAIQIIIEGYSTFYELLKNRLKDSNYALIYQDIGDPDNNAGILINLNQFELLNSEIYVKSYYEKYDRENEKIKRKVRNLRVPIGFLRPYNSIETLVVGAVHIPGSNRRYPVTGLEYLNNIIQNIINKNQDYVVFMGDFNCIPKVVGDNIKNMKIMLSNYPTHVNPSVEVSFYDMALIRKKDSSEKGDNISMLDLEYTSIYTQALVESIYMCSNKI
jgi:hypothetical protein